MKYRLTRRTVLSMVVSAFMVFAGPEEAVQAAHRGTGLAVSSGLSIPLTLYNLAPSTSFAAPKVSYSHAFADGDVPVGGSVTATDSLGNPVTVQMDAVAPWPSGCPRWAVISHACAETFSGASNKVYTLGSSNTAPNNTPSGAWAGNVATTMAANTDFKAVYSGFDAGASTYTVSLNTIMANYSQTFNQAWGTSYPTGGWELTKSGPVCVEFHGWQYIINDTAPNKTHGYVRCDIWVKAWSPTGPFETRVQTSLPNMWGTVPNNSGAEQFGNRAGRWATALTVKNGATVIQATGTTADPNATTVPTTNFTLATNRLSNTTFLPQCGVSFTSTGTLPSGMSAGVIYFPAIASTTTSLPYLCVDRAAQSALEGPSGGSQNAWAASTAYTVGVYRKNGATYYRCVTAGTSASSGGPTGTGSSIADGTAVWENATIIFGTQGTGTITAFTVGQAYPSTGWIAGDTNGFALWNGSGTRPLISAGHDFTYLTTKSKFTLCYNSNAGFQTTNQALPVYLPNQNFGGLTWQQAAGGDGASDQRIGYMSNFAVASLFNPADPYYAMASVQAGLCWDNFPYNHMNDESGGNPFVGNNGTNNSGTGYSNLPALVPNWNGNNVAGSPSNTIVGRGAGWSQWSQANQDFNGLNGQYYATAVPGAHMPATWQVAYLRTGEPCFLDMGIQQANTQCFMGFNGKQTLSGTTYYCLMNGLSNSCQLRAWAWSWRSLCQALYMLPSNHIFFPVLRDYYNDNIAYQSGRLAGFSAAQATFGILNVLDHGGTGDTAMGHLAPWMGYFLYLVVAMETWRGGLTNATAGTQFGTLLDYMSAQWNLYTSAVDPNAVNAIGAYDLVYSPTTQVFTSCYTSAGALFDASFSQVAQLTGSISTTVLNVSGVTSGALVKNGDVSTAGGVQYGNINGQITGVNAGNITASITAKVMTVASVNAGGPLTVGQVLNGGGVAESTIVGTQISGTTGGAGDYNVNISQTLGSATIQFDTPGGVGTYRLSTSHTLGSGTLYVCSPTANVLPGPKYLSYLYDQNAPSANPFQTAANYPENCNWYGSMARACLTMGLVCRPGNATMIAVRTALINATIAATGINTGYGGVQWHGVDSSTFIQNYQTFAV